MLIVIVVTGRMMKRTEKGFIFILLLMIFILVIGYIIKKKEQGYTFQMQITP